MKEPFIDMYEKYYDDVYRYARWKTPNSWDADDIVSEVFRKAFEHHRTLRDQTNPKAWLLTITRNAVTDFYRRKRNTIPSDGIEQESGDPPMVERLIRGDELDCLRSALQYLPEPDQEIVSLRYFAEMKFDGIGQVLGKPGSTVKVRTGRLLKKLGIMVRRCMEGADKNE